MKNLFYIVEVKPHWYNLRTTNNHYTLVAGSSLETLLNSVFRYCTKYKTEEKLMKRLRKMEDRGLTPQKTLVIYQQQYNESGDQFKDLIDEQVEKAMQYNRENTPYKRARKKVTPNIKAKPQEVKETKNTCVVHNRCGLRKITRLA